VPQVKSISEKENDQTTAKEIAEKVHCFFETFRNQTAVNIISLKWRRPPESIKVGCPI